jgi:SagB-type dehydrogenase family enzyme
MNEDKIKKLNKQGREMLKPDWNDLLTKETPRGKGEIAPLVVKPYDEDSKIIKLKKTEIIDISSKTLHEVIESRRSLRKYKDIPLSMDQLSYLFYETSRLFKIENGRSFRVYPTGGATASLETYVYINKVEGLEKGMYRYLPLLGDLLYMYNNELLEDKVNVAIKKQLRGGAVVFFWTAIPERTEYKYSFTSHKMIAMEAGHTCQNLSLASEAIDFGAVAISAYDQELCDKVLKIDGENEFVIYSAVVGKK